MENRAEDKLALRNVYRARRAAIPQARRKQAAQALFRAISTHLPNEGRVLSFETRSTEIDMELVNAHLRAQGRLVLPDQEGDLVLALIPGLVFDKEGYRIGYGGGYYDKFLAKHPQLHTIGVGFTEQLYEGSLPHQAHDIPVRELVLV